MRLGRIQGRKERQFWDVLASWFCHAGMPHRSVIEWSPIAQLSDTVAQLVKNPPSMWDTRVRSLGWEDPLEEEWQPAFLPGESSWTGQPSRLQSMESQSWTQHWWSTPSSNFISQESPPSNNSLTFPGWCMLWNGWAVSYQCSILVCGKTPGQKARDTPSSWDELLSSRGLPLQCLD